MRRHVVITRSRGRRIRTTVRVVIRRRIRFVR